MDKINMGVESPELFGSGVLWEGDFWRSPKPNRGIIESGSALGINHAAG
ncbi:MAG TPA: hypothetical protein IGS52_02360 [Oscillatoriaceae cyanobacterium M33_DOE_052]|nr:hypothetical protein [Oscillatoriaceae cyanobacterium M33_DOE_052]